MPAVNARRLSERCWPCGVGTTATIGEVLQLASGSFGDKMASVLMQMVLRCRTRLCEFCTFIKQMTVGSQGTLWHAQYVNA